MSKLIGLIGTICTCLVLVTNQVAQSAPFNPNRAKSFHDTIGINVHLPYTGTVYDQNWQDIIKPRLGELGVRLIRDGIPVSRPDVVEKMKELYNLYGIKGVLISGPNSSTPQEALPWIKKVGVDKISVIEGWNEPNLNDGPAIVSQVISYQKELYNVIKGDTLVAGLPVAFASVLGDRSTVGEATLNYHDLGTLHNYLGGRNPETPGWGEDGYGSLEWHFRQSAINSRNKPIISTETGWHDIVPFLDGFAGTHEDYVGIYMPRLFLFNFKKGITATIPYELINLSSNKKVMDDNFGLLRNDGSPKPSFLALRNMIKIIRDDSPKASDFDLKPLALSLSGNLKEVESVLLQKGDGSYVLALWLNRESFDPGGQKGRPLMTENILVRFDTKVFSVQANFPNDNQQLETMPLNDSNVMVPVQDKVVLLKIVTDDVPISTKTPTPVNTPPVVVSPTRPPVVANTPTAVVVPTLTPVAAKTPTVIISPTLPLLPEVVNTPIPSNPPATKLNLLIDCGADSDSNFKDGESEIFPTNKIDTQKVKQPISQAAYQTVRYGPSFVYTIPAVKTKGKYIVTLHFAELASFAQGKGARVFNVTINGRRVFRNFDIWKRAGGLNKAIALHFRVSPNKKNEIEIKFEKSKSNNPHINAIQIVEK
jgi:cell division septation protein DedD